MEDRQMSEKESIHRESTTIRDLRIEGKYKTKQYLWSNNDDGQKGPQAQRIYGLGERY
jgi:hypothetical protein